MSLLDRAVVRVLPVVPRTLVRRVSAPYIAGPTLADARRTVLDLAGVGKTATVDVLGEEITHIDEARAIAAAYHGALGALQADGVEANISVKLTGLGLKLDRDLCRELLTGLVVDASGRDGFVRIDMEDSSCVDETLALYRELREEGHTAVGIVLQAYLERTLADIEELRALRPSVRLCKGIYVEPPGVAFQDADVVRRSYSSCLEALLQAGCRVGIATHDEILLADALGRVSGLDPGAYEFQMLLGVREGRADELVAAGHRLRVYVPYGEKWYEYSLRRLQENPSLAGTVATATLRRALGRAS